MANKNTPKERIFVQIASYRDPECQWTVKDLFEKASHPDRISVGICWQFVPEDDKDCFEIPYPRPKQVRVINVHAKDSMGVCWARARTQTLWQGEEYTLQIDAHMRFEPGWDDLLIAMCKQSGLEKPVISTYPPGYTPPGELQKGWVFSMKATRFDENGILLMCGHGIPEAQAPAKPMRGAFAAAGFFFAPSAIIKEVPYDPYLYFFGEEITLITRAWTHGWDFFHPNKPVIYHDWERKDRKRTHFDDHRDWPTMNARAFARVLHLLGMKQSDDPLAIKDIVHFGLGTARTLAEYEAFSGINFQAKTISEFSKSGAEYPAYNTSRASVLPQPLPRKGEAHPLSTSTGATAMTHKPKKIFESEEGIVYDDFLPESVYDQLYDFMCCTDYEHINTKGKVTRVWRPRDGFPLRSTLNLYHFSDGSKCPNPKPEWAYPTNTALDRFAEHMNALLPEIQHFVGNPAKDFDRYSVTSWLYPRGTGLSLHDDGAGIYAGAFAYFVSPYWDIHWGGLLMMLDKQINHNLQFHKKKVDPGHYYRKKWIDPTEENAFLYDPGFAKCIFPKRNRIAFISPDAYHFVTKVTEDAGDNVRMSLAGFFMRPGAGT